MSHRSIPWFHFLLSIVFTAVALFANTSGKAPSEGTGSVEIELSNAILRSGQFLPAAETILSSGLLYLTAYDHTGLAAIFGGYLSILGIPAFLGQIRGVGVNHLDGPYGGRLFHKYRDRIAFMCRTGECSIKIMDVKSYGKDSYKGFRVEFNDGWYFDVGRDPNVIEVKTKPISAMEYSLRKEQIQQYLYDTAASVGLKPMIKNSPFNGGHVNLGLNSHFKSEEDSYDVLLFRNFIVDFYNHGELAMGVLLKDSISAKAVIDQPKYLTALREIIREFDEKYLNNSRSEDRDEQHRQIVELSKKLDAFFSNKLNRKSALNFKSMAYTDENTRRIEVRSSRAPKDSEYLFLIVNLFQSRIQALKRWTTPIPLRTEVGSTDKSKQLSVFQSYVEGSGLLLEDYRHILSPDYVKKFDQMNFRPSQIQCLKIYAG